MTFSCSGEAAAFSASSGYESPIIRPWQISNEIPKLSLDRPAKQSPVCQHQNVASMTKLVPAQARVVNQFTPIAWAAR